MRDVVWGSVVLLLALVVCTWWLAALAAEPNWSEIALAVGTAVLAVATAGLALAAFLALGSIDEARAARNATAALELSKQWDSEDSLRSRWRVDELSKKLPGRFGSAHSTPGPDGLRISFERLALQKNPEYGTLLRQTNFLDDIAILIKYKGVDFDMVYDSLGFNIAYLWTLWKPTIDWLREDQPDLYIEFEKLSKRIASRHPKFTVRQDGEVAWPGFSK